MIFFPNFIDLKIKTKIFLQMNLKIENSRKSKNDMQIYVLYHSHFLSRLLVDKQHYQTQKQRQNHIIIKQQSEKIFRSHFLPLLTFFENSILTFFWQILLKNYKIIYEDFTIQKRHSLDMGISFHWLLSWNVFVLNKGVKFSETILKKEKKYSTRNIKTCL